MGIVTEIGEGPSRGGRRPIVLEFQDDACVILGVEMGATHVVAALTDLRGPRADLAVARAPRAHRPGRHAAADRRAVPGLPGRAGGRRRGPLVGIGVAVPCPVDPSHPDRLSTIVLPAWEARLGLDDLAAPLRRAADGRQRRQPGRPGRTLVGRRPGRRRPRLHQGGHGHRLGARDRRRDLPRRHRRGRRDRPPVHRPAGQALHLRPARLPGHAGRRAGPGGPRRRTGRRSIPQSPLAGREITILDLENAALAGDPLALQVAQEAAGAPGPRRGRPAEHHEPVAGHRRRRCWPGWATCCSIPLRETVKSRTLVSSVAAAEIRTGDLGDLGDRRRAPRRWC